MKLNSPNKRVSRSTDGDAPSQIALHNPAPPAFNCVVLGIISESFVVEHKPGSRRLQGVFRANSFAYRSINAQTNPRESQGCAVYKGKAVGLPVANCRRYFKHTFKSFGHSAVMVTTSFVTGWVSSKLSACNATREISGLSSCPGL